MASKAKSTNSSPTEDTPGLPATSDATTALPDFMRGMSGDGKENIGADDVVTPRVSLMQAVSPEVIDGLVPSGHFWHSVLERDMGPELEFIPVFMFKRYILWRPRHEGGGILARASDGVNWDTPNLEFEIAPYKDMPKKKVKLQLGQKVGREIGLGKWGSLDPENPDSPPAATLSYNILCFLPTMPEVGPFILSLQRSAEGVAKQLFAKVKGDPAPLYGQRYKMGSKNVTSGGNDFNVPTFTKNGYVQDEAMFRMLREQHEFFKSTGVKFDESPDEVDEAAAGGGEAPVDDKSGGRF